MSQRATNFAAAVPASSSPSEPEQRSGSREVGPDGHLDKALDRQKVEKFEDAVELWKVYGES